MVVGQPPFNDISVKVVMDEILYLDFESKDWFSKNLKDILSKLLQKKPENRLGCSPERGGYQEIMQHPFFKDIDWGKLISKEIKPPIKPKVKSESDTKNIDGAFLKEKIGNTPT